jgi:hypothetical protein
MLDHQPRIEKDDGAIPEILFCVQCAGTKMLVLCKEVKNEKARRSGTFDQEYRHVI